ncbi:MAG: GTPase domain-containing protein [Candidatus Magnetoglobus multicellularis str. Araruama]|uniref:GTPase domain-containing protein n=1 Tax=Candidatus Magnetoglobus multicellularis str. Araruama TaxID=890399 RepID=A0A1V1P5F2_9BACT|nr:MAG: GTPase domain-containing protein [Candidatus Magnetoglobus multicellularis str. Araruama]
MSEENQERQTQEMENSASLAENSVEETTEDVSKETIDKLIRNHVYGSMAVGLVPLPMVDFIGVTGIQLNMVRKIAKLYDIPFSREITKNIIIALVGGAVPSVTSFSVASAVKAIPIVGFSLGAVSMPVISGASTYAVGKVFYRHFASGGTFLTFDVDKAKAYYADMFQQGKNLSQTLQPQPA